MTIRINKETVFHYFLLYLLIIWQDAGIKLYFGTTRVETITLVVSGLCILQYARCRSKWMFLFSAVLLGNVVIVRFLTAGVGISYLMSSISGISIATVAVTFNSEKFAYRFVRIVSFFAAVSLLMWLFTLLFPEIFQRLSLISYSPYSRRVYTTAEDYFLRPVSYYGGLLYVARVGNDLTRNNGLFNEPGLYQMVLNTALFLVMFYPKQCSKNQKEQTGLTYLLILTIVTCQSTTGYLSLLMIIVAYMVVHKKTGSRIKIIRLIVGAIILFAMDAITNGEESLLSTVIRSKINISSSGIEFIGSGIHRVNTTLIVLGALLKSPWGIGFDRFEQLITLAGKTSSDGTALMVAFGSLGIQMLAVLIIFVAVPMVKRRTPFLLFVTALFMYINTTMGQSSIFYPALLVLCLVPDLNLKQPVSGEGVGT